MLNAEVAGAFKTQLSRLRKKKRGEKLNGFMYECINLAALLLSIMIMPSEDEIGSAAGQGGGNVTQPFVTETYRVVAPYETRDTKNKPFKVVMDDKVDVLIKDKAGEQARFGISCPVKKIPQIS